MSTDLKKAVQAATFNTLQITTGSDIGTGPCDDPYAQPTGTFQRPPTTKYPEVDALRPDINPKAKAWVRERIELQQFRFVFYLPYGSELEPKGEGFYITDSPDYNRNYEKTLESASDVVIHTARDGNVDDAKLAYELTYGINKKENGKKVEWDRETGFTKNVIKRAEYEP